MSLKVWLPLDGNLNNYGCSPISILTQSNVTIDNAGKIGKCYSFRADGNASYLLLDRALFDNNTTEWSYACWFKAQDPGANYHCLFSNRTSVTDNGIAIFVGTASNYAGSIFFDTGKRFNASVTVPLNTWTHLAFTFKLGAVKKIYMNGVEVASTTDNATAPVSGTTTHSMIGSSQGTPITATGNYTKGQLNDIRIYDHCLSPEEVREISQGLILHYKLDDIINANLLTGNVNSLGVLTMNQCTAVLDDGGIKATITSDSGDRRIYYTVSNVWTPVNSTFTVSFDAKASTNGLQLNVSRSNITSDMINFNLTTEWKHYSGQIINTDAATGGTLSFQCPTNGATFWIKNAKLERGNVETQFIPSGVASTQIIDSSGYGHDGIIIGASAAAVTSSSSRYNTALSFNATGTTNHIECPSLPSTVQTITCWVKADKSVSQVLFADKATLMGFGLYSNDSAIIRATATGARRSIVNFVSNQWNYIAVVKNDMSSSSYKLYINGIEETTTMSQNYWGHEVDNLWLFNRTTNSNFAANASMSDFRAYVTVLSDSDIRSLYETSAIISNSAFHAGEYDENNDNITINNNTIVECSQLCELPSLSLLKYDTNVYIEPDKSVWVHVYHHNNPAGGSFSSSNDFANSVYIDENRWFNVEVANQIDKWEIMMKGKYTSTGTEWKVRWIQQYNPMTATYANVASANVTKITNGYDTTPSGWGGLYKKNASAYLTTNNGTEGNWWGAVGSFSVYQGGIPGWCNTTVTTSGYNDMYLRIDNLTNATNSTTQFKKSGAILAHHFIEG